MSIDYFKMKGRFSACGRRLSWLAAAVAVVLPACLVGCSHGAADPVVKVNRLDRALEGGWPVDREFVAPAEVLFRISGYGGLNDSTLARYVARPSVMAHVAAVDSVWAVTGKLESRLGRIKAGYGKLFPDKVFPQVYAVVSPFNQSVFTADTFLYVGLNHYLGADYPPYGYFPEYIRKRKTPRRVAADITEALLRRDFPYAPREEYPTVLSRLLYEGAIVEAMMQVDGISEQEALGYDDGQMDWLNRNERRLWEEMAGRKYLFSTDKGLASSLTALSPFTSAIGSEVPGAAGRFIGHRIVSSYLDNRAVPISYFLSPDFYESPTALAESKYK